MRRVSPCTERPAPKGHRQESGRLGDPGCGVPATGTGGTALWRCICFARQSGLPLWTARAGNRAGDPGRQDRGRCVDLRRRLDDGRAMTRDQAVAETIEMLAALEPPGPRSWRGRRDDDAGTGSAALDRLGLTDQQIADALLRQPARRYYARRQRPGQARRGQSHRGGAAAVRLGLD